MDKSICSFRINCRVILSFGEVAVYFSKLKGKIKRINKYCSKNLSQARGRRYVSLKHCPEVHINIKISQNGNKDIKILQ